MGFLGFGRKSGTYLVVVTSEGSTRLRLNGNQMQSSRIKKNAAEHLGTVCWIEFEVGGPPRDQGLGPAASRLRPGEAERLLRELPRLEACRALLAELKQSPAHASRW